MCRDFCYILYVYNIWKLKYNGIEAKQKKLVSIIYVAVQNIRAQPIIKGSVYMKKKALICCLAVLAITVVAFICASKANPIYTAAVSSPANIEAAKNGGSYCADVMFGYNEHKLLHTSSERQKKTEQYETVQADLDEFRKEVADFQKPYMIDADYKNVDGKTVITFSGTVTDPNSGEAVPFERSYQYDFILTDKINK